MEWLPRDESQQPWTLARGEIHVYRLALDAHGQPPADRFAILDDAEHARSERLLPGRRVEFMTTRAALRRILGAHLGLSPAALSFVAAEQGKPELKSDQAGDLRFNVAHSGGLALIAVARAVELGIDLEQVRDVVDMRGVSHRFFSEREWRTLESLPPEQQRLAFFRCWSRKEAMIKANGSGIASGLGSDVPGQWWLYDLDPWEGFAAALAADAPGLTVHTWTIAA